MNNIITASMFDSIKQALVKNENNSVGKFMKTEVGNTYTVRLLPNIKDPSKTFFHYFTFGWTSYSTGQYINLVSPQTWGDRDPINEYRYKITKTGSQEEKDKASKILRKENWLVNVYVINDPKNPENNGQVKLLKFGRQLHKIIMDAIEGEDSDSLGSRIFDLSGKGCDFKVKVDKQGEYPSYSSSKFTMPKAIENLTENKIQEIYNDTIDLERVFTVKSYDELTKVLNEHYHCTATPAAKEDVKVNIIEAATPVAQKPVSKAVAEAETSLNTQEEDDDISKILEQLNS